MLLELSNPSMLNYPACSNLLPVPSFCSPGWEKLIVGMVDYIIINDIKKHRFLGFRRIEPYSYENEPRFVALLNPSEERSFLELPLSKLNDHDFKIITHPAMEKWEVKLLRTMVEKFQLENKFANSKIILRK